MSQEDFMQTVRSVKEEGKQVEKMARLVADGCTDDKMKKVCQHPSHNDFGANFVADIYRK